MGFLTSEQLEYAARKYCALSRLEPDEIVSAEGLTLPRWKIVASKIKIHDALTQLADDAKSQA